MPMETNPELAARLDELSRQVTYLVERQKKQDELIDELAVPVGREALKNLTFRLDDLEKKGYFAFGRELAKAAQRVVEGYTPDDVRLLGEAATGILDTVRAMTQPEVLSVLGEASQIIARADQTEPIGLVGMVRATRHEDVQRGMAVMMELLGKLGKGARALAQKKTAEEDRKAKLAALLGPKRDRKVLGIERTPRLPPAVAAPKPSPPLAAPKAAGTIIDGVAFTADGQLADPAVWTHALGESIAHVLGVPMTDEHWAVVNFARKDWETTKASPNIRRITQSMGIDTKQLYALFPKAPGRTVARIAGIPKPAGCL